MHRVMRSRLQPPTLPAGVVLGITVLFVVLTFARGLALARRPGILEQLRPDGDLDVNFFGVVLMACAVYFVLAVLTRRHLLVWVGHVLIICAYLTYGYSIAAACLAYGGGWDLVVAPIGGVIWHSLLSQRMRPIPRHPGCEKAKA